MDPRRWEEIQTAFDALVELDAAERPSRLATLGSTDPELRAAVESLLAADTEADAWLARLEAPFLSAALMPDLLGLNGRSVSHFKVLEPLGAGGMGVVYRAEDTRLTRSVALKFLLPQSSLDSSAKARFLREARAAAALDHPNLCTIYEVGESEGGRLFLAMALYSGETLKARLAREGREAVGTALQLAREIAQGLGCAHAAGIVHRDLKPGNVMVLPDGAVKILDFGLAKAQDESLSATGARLGTGAYMAPEQVLGQTVDARADLWALGVVLYEMLTGQKPFGGEDAVTIAHAIVHNEPVSPSKLRDGLPAAVDHVVLALLRKDPRTRYATVEELIADLAGVGTLGDSAVRVRASGLLTRHRRRATRRWLVPLGAVLVIGAVGEPAIARWLRPVPPRPVSRYTLAVPDAEALAFAANRYNRIAISPDGERIAYVGPSPGGGSEISRGRLWIRKRDQPHATPLAGTEGAANPFFSPDGSRLGFLATGHTGALKVVSLDGGPPTTVTDVGVDLGGAAWGYDGYIYFDGQLEGDGLARVPERGGVPEPVTRCDSTNGEMWHYQPEPLPNGRGVLFVAWRGNRYESYIAVLDLKSGVHRLLLRGLSPRYAASGHLIYATADGRLWAAPFDQDRLAIAGAPVVLTGGLGVIQGEAMQDLAVSATGTLVYTTSTGASNELVWVARDGKTTPIDSTWRAAFTSVALSPDGAELAAGVQSAYGTEVWIKRLDQGPASRLDFLGSINDFPAWTPDGRAVTVLSNSGSRSNDLDLYVSQADGRALPQRLRDEAGSLQDAEYSRDGKWLVYRTNSDLFAVRTAGDTTPIPLVATQFSERSPRVSPDGRWLAYVSDESGFNVYVRPFPNTGSARWLVSPVGGADPVWSPSGRELFYKSNLMGLVAAAVLPGDTFALGRQQVLFSITKYVNYWQWSDYDVTPDGRRFVMIRSAGQPHDQVIVVENFFEELKASVKR